MAGGLESDHAGDSTGGVTVTLRVGPPDVRARVRSALTEAGIEWSEPLGESGRAAGPSAGVTVFCSESGGPDRLEEIRATSSTRVVGIFAADDEGLLRRLIARGLDGAVFDSDLEEKILGMVVLGMPNSEIAGRLVLAESTVKSHLHSSFRKLGVRSRNEAVARILDPSGHLGTGNPRDLRRLNDAPDRTRRPDTCA